MKKLDFPLFFFFQNKNKITTTTTTTTAPAPVVSGNGLADFSYPTGPAYAAAAAFAASSSLPARLGGGGGGGAAAPASGVSGLCGGNNSCGLRPNPPPLELFGAAPSTGVASLSSTLPSSWVMIRLVLLLLQHN